MKDNRIYNALKIITNLLSTLHDVPINNFDYVNGKMICLECGRDWYDRGHLGSKCKTIKLSELYNISTTFDEG
jgi:hypothetical protein